MKSLYTLAVVTENSLEIVNRLSVVFSRNRLFLQKINFEKKGAENHSDFQIEVCADAKTIERIMNQLKRIIEVVSVNIINQKLL